MVNNRIPTKEELVEQRPFCHAIISLWRDLTGKPTETPEDEQQQLFHECMEALGFLHHSPIAFEEFTKFLHTAAYYFADLDDIEQEHWKEAYLQSDITLPFSVCFCMIYWKMDGWLDRHRAPRFPAPPFIIFK